MSKLTPVPNEEPSRVIEAFSTGCSRKQGLQLLRTNNPCGGPLGHGPPPLCTLLLCAWSILTPRAYACMPLMACKGVLPLYLGLGAAVEGSGVSECCVYVCACGVLV
eukprot:Sspe_Gene.80638::Locus_51009_Transcript_1_1_Confidence_1.000_Length_446::g.80638::m.80638